MVHDWQMNQTKGNGDCFHQLFVCRSKSLLEEVRKAYTMRHEDSGSSEGTIAHFRTLSRFLDVMDMKITERCGPSLRNYVPSKRMTYAIFRDEFFSPYNASLPAKKRITIDACVIWTQIQSHIKGSTEAVYDAIAEGLTAGVDRIGVSLEKYLSFAPDRCRLAPDKREVVYDVYRLYTHFLYDHDAWDDCDRTTDMLVRSRLDGTIDYSNMQGLPYHKVYVDEVQDSTQVEILLFVLAVGKDSKALFMAGDPAQSIVEGVDFRFEEIRSILHDNREPDKKEAIAKVQSMKRNFRSHQGILECAAKVLGILFNAFPAAAKVLHKDEGLCRGPRPGYIRDYLHTESRSGSFLSQILSKNDRYTVLCHDGELSAEGGPSSTCSFLTSIPPNKMPDIYTIRDSKGMEYDKVIIVNFFCKLPQTDQKHWKRRLRDNSEPEQQCPQMEGQLKLLYTAITRCCQNLVLVETKESVAGVAFFNWLKEHSLAEEILEVPEGEGFRTNDEWKVEGIKAIMSAHGDNAIERLSRGIICFEKARQSADFLRVRASLQKEVELLRLTLHTQLVDGLLPASIERKAARLLKDSLDKALTSQAYDLCKLVAPHVAGGVYRKSIFEKEVMKKLTPAFEM
jgi:hypothetical protein